MNRNDCRDEQDHAGKGQRGPENHIRPILDKLEQQAAADLRRAYERNQNDRLMDGKRQQ